MEPGHLDWTPPEHWTPIGKVEKKHLDAERKGLGAIRFVGGRPYWVKGEKVRFA